MSPLTSFATLSVVVVHPAMVDQHGVQVPDWETATRRTIDECWFAEPQGQEQVAGRRDAVASKGVLHAPFDAGIEVIDRVEFDDLTYEVDGPVMVKRSPTGRLNHLRMDLLLWEG